jgi:Fur family ferric uptake transcriptional regulator
VTLAPLREPKSFATVDEAIGAMREAGHRVSAPSRHILGTLFSADGPRSAEQLAGSELDLTSVYRNLERLEQLGIVSHVHLGHGPGLYALARDGDREYLVCDGCGRVTSLSPAALDAVRAQIRDAFGHHARFSHFAIHGHCESCGAGAGHVHEHHH